MNYCNWFFNVDLHQINKSLQLGDVSKVGHPRLFQLLHPLTTPRLLPFQTSGGEHYCRFKWLSTNCVLTKTQHLRDFPRPFGLGCASIRAAYSGSDARYSEDSVKKVEERLSITLISI